VDAVYVVRPLISELIQAPTSRAFFSSYFGCSQIGDETPFFGMVTNIYFHLYFFYHFHSKCRFFIQICNFSSKSGKYLKGMKTLMAIFFLKFANIVLDSHFWKKKIAIWR
jgi:hypothetical protein